MSYDIFVQDLPEGAKTVEDIPDDFKPAVLGKRSMIIERIIQVVPSADFRDPAWGQIDGDGWSIEVNMAKSEECQGFAFHVHGGSAALDVVATILQHLKLRALDPQADGGFFGPTESKADFVRWSTYRDQVKNKNRS
jgi:hypothetical protein